LFVCVLVAEKNAMIVRVVFATMVGNGSQQAGRKRRNFAHPNSAVSGRKTTSMGSDHWDRENAELFLFPFLSLLLQTDRLKEMNLKEMKEMTKMAWKGMVTTLTI